jgi:tRNA G26 N,N-dimethylase Trm1
MLIHVNGATRQQSKTIHEFSLKAATPLSLDYSSTFWRIVTSKTYQIKKLKEICGKKLHEFGPLWSVPLFCHEFRGMTTDGVSIGE